jgi:hypothetical protein
MFNALNCVSQLKIKIKQPIYLFLFDDTDIGNLLNRKERIYQIRKMQKKKKIRKNLRIDSVVACSYSDMVDSSYFANVIQMS